MKVVVLILLYIAHCNCLVQYDDPTQVYVLTPDDYNYAEYIDIEMWGGGASGAPCLGLGGASGSYARISTKTNNETFYFKVGQGG